MARDAEAPVRLRLAAMMALIYAVQGAFWPVLSLHLVDVGVSERGRGWIFATMVIASFATPLGAGQLVDRLMPTQRFLSAAFAGGGLILAPLGSGAATSGPGLFALFLAYWLLMAPCNSLGNSLAFRNLARPDRDYPRVRVWGTVGWMAVGWLVSAVMGLAGDRGRGAAEAFWIAAGFSVVTSAYCLTLPDTPPIRLVPGGRRTSAARDVVDLVRMPGVAVYLVAAFGISVTTPFVYQVIPHHLRSIGMGRAWVASAMSLGQWPEVAGVAAIPTLIRRWGFRATLAVGAGAYALRFGMLAADPGLGVAAAGIPLHGVGVACFSIVGQVFLNGRAAADRRATAQALNAVVNGGLGSITGSLLAGEALRRSPGRPGLVFLVPCLIDLALVALILTQFRPTAGPGRAVEPPGDRGG